jgi:gamma-glutamylaminecyclotransferase
MTKILKDESTMAKILLAVYGTLKRGNGNHSFFLDNKDSKFLGTGVTDNRYIMLNYCSGFPGIVRPEDGHDASLALPCKVEVFEVSVKVAMKVDNLEGYPTFYDKEITTITLADGSKVSAYIYFLNEDSLQSPLSFVNGDGNYEWFRGLEKGDINE